MCNIPNRWLCHKTTKLKLTEECFCHCEDRTLYLLGSLLTYLATLIKTKLRH